MDTQGADVADGWGWLLDGNVWAIVGGVLVVLFAAAPLASWLTQLSDHRSPVRNLERWTAVVTGTTAGSDQRAALQEAIDDQALRVALAALAPPCWRMKFFAWYMVVASVAMGTVLVLGYAVDRDTSGSAVGFIGIALFLATSAYLATTRARVRRRWIRREYAARGGRTPDWEESTVFGRWLS